MNPFENSSPSKPEKKLSKTPDTNRGKKDIGIVSRKGKPDSRKNVPDIGLARKIPEAREPRPEDRIKTEARMFIEDELQKRKEDITLDNFEEMKTEILDEVRKQGLDHEEAETQIDSYLGNRVSVLNQKQRLALEREPGKKREMRDVNYRHSQWMRNTEKLIEAFQDNPQEIESYWSDFEKTYQDSSPDIKIQKDALKYGVLAQVAAKGFIIDLIEKVKEKGKSDFGARIEEATPDEDVADSVDFWIIAKCGRFEKKIPCQVTHLDVNTGKDQDIRDSRAFVNDNYINFGCPNLSNSKYNKIRVKNKISDFYRKHPKGIFILLPKNENVLIRDNGKLKEDVKERFISETIQNYDVAHEFMS